MMLLPGGGCAIRLRRSCHFNIRLNACFEQGIIAWWMRPGRHEVKGRDSD